MAPNFILVRFERKADVLQNGFWHMSLKASRRNESVSGRTMTHKNTCEPETAKPPFGGFYYLFSVI